MKFSTNNCSIAFNMQCTRHYLVSKTSTNVGIIIKFLLKLIIGNTKSTCVILCDEYSWICVRFFFFKNSSIISVWIQVVVKAHKPLSQSCCPLTSKKDFFGWWRPLCSGTSRPCLNPTLHQFQWCLTFNNRDLQPFFWTSFHSRMPSSFSMIFLGLRLKARFIQTWLLLKCIRF